jgi:anti-sigma B factor antagonist
MILRTSLHPELDAQMVTFHGELDAAAAPDLDARLNEVLAATEGALLLDLAGCTFIDSLGIAALVRGSRQMLEQGRSVAVAVPSSQVRRMLTLTGIDALLEVCWSREDALRWLAEQQQAG